MKYDQILEDTESTNFRDLAEKLQETVSFDVFLLLCHRPGLL